MLQSAVSRGSAPDLTALITSAEVECVSWVTPPQDLDLMLKRFSAIAATSILLVAAGPVLEPVLAPVLGTKRAGQAQADDQE